MSTVGQGTVTADGRQVAPDPGVAIYAFTGAMINVPSAPPPPTAPAPGNESRDGDPVDLGTGLFVLEQTDLALPDVLPITLTRTYRPNDTAVRPFGIGATHPYAMYLWSAQQYQQADLVLPDGARVHYGRTSPGTSWTDAVFAHTATPTLFYQSRIVWNGNGWDLTLRDGTVYVFGENAPLQAIRDRNGNTITLTWSSTNSYGSGLGNLVQVTSPNGRWLAFSYDTSNRITQATDNAGRTVGYTYDAAHRMLTITDARGITFLTNQYDANGRVSRQTMADGGVYQYAYTADAGGTVTQTDVTNPRGSVRRLTFNASGYVLTDTRAVGQPAAQTATITRQAGSNFATSTTDPLGRRTDFSHDALGNLISMTELAGTPNAVTTTYTYEPAYNQIATITDPLNHTTTLTYDAQGNLIRLTDPRSSGVHTDFTYNAAGQVLTATTPLGAGHTTQMTYAVGDLATVTDPLGRQAVWFTDGAGRVSTVTDPLGNQTRAEYDRLNRITRTVNPLGGATVYTYDANSNLLSVTDPRQTAAGTAGTVYTYDTMDRLATRRDPLLHTESYTHDTNGNLTQVTDRRGQMTTYTYDALDRRTFAGYGTTGLPGTPTYESTISTAYDAANRRTQVVDSLAGAITRTYDPLTDEVASETTPQGSVSYTYDAAGRRTSMTVAGQASVGYTYDAADRLTQITQGTTTVAVGSDDANRRTSLTLPGGVAVSSTYDAADQLTGMTYIRGGTTLGALTYGYDAAGRRTSMGGSYARTGLPAAVSAVSYDAANRLVAWGSTTYTYDNEGNLTGDGPATYTWNARNQLAAMTSGGGPTASFQYDGAGRRQRKTVSGTTTELVYDGQNPVQEKSGAAVLANLLTGLDLDEVFARADGAGLRTFLTDALGSTLALADDAGMVRTQYTYEPFGGTSASGEATTNTFQYTGRENDGGGRYYYRARYYQPGIERFVSEDPLPCERRKGMNLYAYAENDPVDQTDPTGLRPIAGRDGVGPEACSYYDDACRNMKSGEKDDYVCNAGNCCRSFGNTPEARKTRKCLIDEHRSKCAKMKNLKDQLNCTYYSHITCYSRHGMDIKPGTIARKCLPLYLV